MKKFGLKLKGHQKCYFSIFTFFIFPYFKWLFLKILWKDHPLLWWISRVLMKFYYVINILIYTLLTQWNDGSLNLFWNLDGNGFCFFIFSKWKKYHNLTFDDTFKSTVVHYANLNSSSISKPFLDYGPSSMLFCFLDFLFMFILTRLLSKTWWKN